jgi:hypothetical protein
LLNFKKLYPIVRSLWNEHHRPTPHALEIVEMLKSSHNGKKEYHAQVTDGLTGRNKLLDVRLEKMMDHLLDSRMTEEEYDTRSALYRSEKTANLDKLNNLEEVDETYCANVAYLFKLCQNAGRLFESSKPEGKRMILNTLLQDCLVNEVTLEPVYRKPFDLLVKCGDRLEWGE